MAPSAEHPEMSNGRSFQASSGPSPFSIENIPFGIITTASNPKKRCGSAFENWAIDLEILELKGIFDDVSDLVEGTFSKDTLNAFAALPHQCRMQVRERLILYITEKELPRTPENAFVPLSDIQNHYPMATQNFSDFYCSLQHTKNCTEIFGKTEINENWYTAPMVYNGRTSSLVVSGTPITRPCGIVQTSESSSPFQFLPTTKLDFELEMGVFLSKPLPRGARLTPAEAREHCFGFVLLNDWSSRDIQVFEMPPLGPFHGKGFGTTISPWIITMEALELVDSGRREVQTPAPLPHLAWKGDEKQATFDIEVSVKVVRNGKSSLVCTSNLNELHWTPYQQLTHLVSAGEGLSTGDIFGTGTISSDRTDEAGEYIGLGCIFERSLQRNRLAASPDFAETYLLDGDEVVMEGWCVSKVTGNMFGFGQCRGVILPALTVKH